MIRSALFCIIFFGLCCTPVLAWPDSTLWTAQACNASGSDISSRARVYDQEFSPDGRYIAVSCEDSISIRDAATGGWVNTFARPESRYRIGTCFSSDSRSLFLLKRADDSEYRYVLEQWDIFSGEKAVVLDSIPLADDYNLRIQGFMLRSAPDGSYLVFVVDVNHWSGATNAYTSQLYTYSFDADTIREYECRGRIYHLDISRDSRYMAYTSGYTYEVNVGMGQFDKQSKVFAAVLSVTTDERWTLPDDNTLPVRFSEDGGSIFLSSGRYNYRAARLELPLPLHSYPSVRGYLCINNGSHFLVLLNSPDYSVGIYDASKNQWNYLYPGQYSSSFSLSPDSRTFVVGNDDGALVARAITTEDTSVIWLAGYWGHVGPNPVPPEGCDIVYEANPGDPVVIWVCDFNGRVIHLFSSPAVSIGRNTFHWNARTPNGERLIPGLYMLNVKTGRDGNLSLFQVPLMLVK